MLRLVALIALSSPAMAQEAPSLSEGWYRYERRDFEGAAAIARQRLEADPHDLGTHRLYILARSHGRHQDDVLTLYRAWHEAEPDGVAARFGLAKALETLVPEVPCDEVDGLLEGLEEEGEQVRYWTVRLRYNLAGRCDGDEDALRQALIEAAAATEAGWSLSVVMRLNDGGLDEGLLADLRRVYETDPSRFTSVSSVWAKGSKGPLVRQARKDALEAVDAVAKGEQPLPILYAWRLLERIEDDRAAELRERLDALDPMDTEQRTAWTDLEREVYEANQRPTHEAALASLDALEHKLPESGRARSMWMDLRRERLEGLGRTDEAYALKRQRAQQEDAPGRLLNNFAYEAAQRGEDLPEALKAVDQALASLDAQGWDPQGWWSWEGWARSRRGTLSAWLDTRGWILFRMGELEQAAEVLQEAVMVSPTPSSVQHAHLGLVLYELGREAEAFEVLVLAHAGGNEDWEGEEALKEESHEVLEGLWGRGGLWAHDGLQGYLAAKRKPVELSGGGEAVGQAHPLIGERFPIGEVSRLTGGKMDLAALEGVVVVDLWATWCGPCVAGMPHLQEVAAAYRDRGVTVVGVSVDDKISAPKRFYKGIDGLDYELAWIGKEGFELAHVGGIPSMFVIDAEGKVATYISGFGGKGDRRLEDALEAALADER